MTTAIKGIDYGSTSIRDMRVDEVDENGDVAIMTINDRPVRPTQRFWTSLCSNFSTQGLTTKLFNLFTHEEVFNRLHDRLTGNGRDRVRFAIEDLGDGPGNLLAITNPTKAVIDYDDANTVLDNCETISREYTGGIIRSTHQPRRMGNVSIGPDDFEYRFVTETPIDGFGKPLVYLSLLRLLCTNGMIGYSKAFRSEVGLGSGDDRADHSLERALDSFNNEEGYAALVQRFEASQNSWASVLESQRLYQVLGRMAARQHFHPAIEGSAKWVNELANRRSATLGSDDETNPTNVNIMRAFSACSGDLVSVYALTHVDALARKRQAQLPAKCTVYDLLNLSTEIATHHTSEANGRQLQALVGELISNEYDLENTKTDYPQFSDWLVDASVSTN